MVRQWYTILLFQTKIIYQYFWMKTILFFSAISISLWFVHCRFVRRKRRGKVNYSKWTIAATFYLDWFKSLDSGVVCYGMVCYAMVWYGVVWCGLVCCGMFWFGVLWYDMVWYDMVWENWNFQFLFTGMHSMNELMPN